MRTLLGAPSLRATLRDPETKLERATERTPCQTPGAQYYAECAEPAPWGTRTEHQTERGWDPTGETKGHGPGWGPNYPYRPPPNDGPHPGDPTSGKPGWFDGLTCSRSLSFRADPAAGICSG